MPGLGVGVPALRLVVIRHGVMPASRGGKAKTMLQTVAIGLLVLPTTGWLEDVALLVMAVAVIVTVVTGVDYVLRALQPARTLSAKSRSARLLPDLNPAASTLLLIPTARPPGFSFD